MPLVQQVFEKSNAQFGTSGLRGLVVDLTDEVVAASVAGFVSCLNAKSDIRNGGTVLLARDLRPSSKSIATAVVNAIQELGGHVINAGTIPTPALVLAGIARGVPSIMVTGSHIPDDRNGIKFFLSSGEITKSDERAIVTSDLEVPTNFADVGLPAVDNSIAEEYSKRYLDVFPMLLSGLRIGLYQHSAVGRDLTAGLLEALGAQTIVLGRTDQFVPIDTEAVSPEDHIKARQWVLEHNLSAVISTDGDGDRPLLSDETGQYFRGDTLGIFAARFLSADTIVTPISSSSALEELGWFKKISRTKIGSPYVLSEMERLAQSGRTTVGFEANGGFCTQSTIELDNAVLSPLPTRDALLPILATLAFAKTNCENLSDLHNLMPARYNGATRIQGWSTKRSAIILEQLEENSQMRDELFLRLGICETINKLDGLRMYSNENEIVHLRPSGNAPELRIYIETFSAERVEQLLEHVQVYLKSLT